LVSQENKDLDPEIRANMITLTVANFDYLFLRTMLDVVVEKFACEIYILLAALYNTLLIVVCLEEK